MKNEFQLPVLWILNSLKKRELWLCENVSMLMHAMNESLVDKVSTGKCSSEPAWPAGWRMFLPVLSVNKKSVQWLHEQPAAVKSNKSVKSVFHKQSYFY